MGEQNLLAKTPFKKDGMIGGANHFIFQNAKHLRRNMADAETVLWFHLKQKQDGCKFRRQHPLGPRIADYSCHKLKIDIEIGWFYS